MYRIVYACYYRINEYIISKKLISHSQISRSRRVPPYSLQQVSPVSLTCICCKLLECIIRDAVMEYLLTNKLFSNKQFGFIPKRSTIPTATSRARRMDPHPGSGGRHRCCVRVSFSKFPTIACWTNFTSMGCHTTLSSGYMNLSSQQANDRVI